MIPCPLCGVEYALASNLEKHIDRDHRYGRQEISLLFITKLYKGRRALTMKAGAGEKEEVPALLW